MKWASWTIGKVTHRLSLRYRITSCGILAQDYEQPWTRRRNRRAKRLTLKDKSRKPPTCLECIAIEAEFGEPRDS